MDASESSVTPAAAGRLRGLTLALGACFFWSLSGILVRLLEAASSWQIVFWRSAGLLLTIVTMLLVVHRGRVLRAVRLAGPIAVVAGLCSCGASAFFILALARTTVANALFMSGITPFLAAIAALALMREPVRRATWIGMALAMTGVVAMLSGNLEGGGLGGSLLALLSACCFAGFSVLVRFGRQEDMLPAVLWSGVAGLLLASIMVTLEDGAAAWDGPFVRVSLHDRLICLFMGSVQLGLGMMLFTRASRELPSAELQLVATVELVIAPLWVAIGVAEYPRMATLIGGGFVLAAVLLQARNETGPREPDA